MPWWTWIIIGFGLIGVELFLPSGFSLLIIGLSFLITGVSVAFGLDDPTWLPWLICFASAVFLLASVRKPLMRLFGFDKPSNYDEMGAEEIVIHSEIASGQIGQGEMRGTTWRVRNIGTTPLHSGKRVKIYRIDGLTVEAKN